MDTGGLTLDSAAVTCMLYQPHEHPTRPMVLPQRLFDSVPLTSKYLDISRWPPQMRDQGGKIDDLGP
jgi:hypothetical protein